MNNNYFGTLIAIEGARTEPGSTATITKETSRYADVRFDLSASGPRCYRLSKRNRQESSALNMVRMLNDGRLHRHA